MLQRFFDQESRGIEPPSERWWEAIKDWYNARMKNGGSNRRAHGDAGLRLIVFYKVVKAAAAWAACVLLLVLMATGKMDEMHQTALVLREHVTNAVSLALARAAVEALTVPHIHLAILALLIDGSFTFFEAWALHRRFWWAAWLILIGTASFLPFELVLLARGVKLGRLIVFLINVAIVVYLARRVWREHHLRFATGPRAGSHRGDAEIAEKDE